MSSPLSFLGRLISGRSNRPAPKARRRRAIEPTLDVMEDRIVLSRMSFGTAATAAFRGGPRGPHGSIPRGGGVQDAQLTANIQKLQTDIQSAIAGSTVTDAQRQALATDLKTIADAGFKLDKTALEPVVDSLLTALADGSYDDTTSGKAAEIQASFTALFADSSVDSAVIEQTYTDLVTVARNLNLSTDELNTLAADRAAIQADLTRLGLPTDKKAPGGSNLELVLAPGFGRFPGRGRGPRF